MSLGDKETIYYNSDGQQALIHPAGEGTQITIGKITNEGQWVWCARIDSPYDDPLASITTDSDGNVYIMGNGGSRPTYYNSDGSIGMNGIQTNDDKSLQLFIGKLSNDGKWIWNASIDSTSDNFAGSIVTDKYNNVYVGGHGAVNTYPTYYNADGSVGMVGTVGMDSQIFIGKLTNQGKWVWNVCVDSSGKEYSLKLSSDNRGNVYSLGTSETTPLFYNTNTISELSGMAKGNQTFVAKLTNEPTTAHFVSLIESVEDGNADVKFTGYIDIEGAVAGKKYYIETTSSETYPNLTDKEYNGTNEYNRYVGTAVSDNVIAWNLKEPDNTTKGRYDVVESSDSVVLLNETIQELIKRIIKLETP